MCYLIPKTKTDMKVWVGQNRNKSALMNATTCGKVAPKVRPSNLQ